MQQNYFYLTKMSFLCYNTEMNEEISQEIVTEPKKPLFKPSFWAFWKEVATFILIAVVIVLPFRKFVAEPFLVDGRSMSPTFETNNYLIVDKLSYRFGIPKRYDVIVMKYPDPNPKNAQRDFIKRIIGLPGETVDIRDGVVSIYNTDNPKGFVTNNKFVKFPKTGENMTVILDSNHYFVMGDNRYESFDSRGWGPLPASNILGKPLVELFPNIILHPGQIK